MHQRVALCHYHVANRTCLDVDGTMLEGADAPWRSGRTADAGVHVGVLSAEAPTNVCGGHEGDQALG